MYLTTLGTNGTACERALRAMFAARKRVFVDLLGWDVPVVADTYEADQFDDLLAQYLVLTDSNGDHLASARLLRTDRPHILGALFPHLCDREIPTGPGIREITRFCLDPSQRAPQRRAARNRLVTALADHALQEGVAGYTGVASPSWFSQIARFGWDCSALGQPVAAMGRELVALFIRIDEDTPERLKRAGIYQPASAEFPQSVEVAA